MTCTSWLVCARVCVSLYVSGAGVCPVCGRLAVSLGASSVGRSDRVRRHCINEHSARGGSTRPLIRIGRCDAAAARGEEKKRRRTRPHHHDTSIGHARRRALATRDISRASSCSSVRSCHPEHLVVRRSLSEPTRWRWRAISIHPRGRPTPPSFTPSAAHRTPKALNEHE